jgi:hypothetical protein
MVPRRIRLLLAALTAVGLVSASLGAASTLGGVIARDLSAGEADVLACDGDGVGITYTTSAGAVQSVTVTGIAAGCAGGVLRVVLANSSGADVGAGGPVTVAGTSEAVALAPQPTAISVAAAHVSITGP